jgi:DNA mismatch repair protein MutL
MGKIHEMSIELANLISAGEVVNRPANAIKELVENSIDAGATTITVEIQNGGTSLMRVSDDGCGMDVEDLVLSVKRHATSKLYSKEDIDSISTMGFRGEALASIAAVTRLRIISKTEDAEYGHMLSIEYGQDLQISERGSSKGTTIIAEDLFYNVPARRKFLKRDASEGGAVIDAVEKLAISHPDIAFRMLSDGVLKFTTPGNGNLEDAIYAVLGKGMRGKLLEVNEFSDGIRISGFIGSPMMARANRQQQFFYVNKRCINSPVLSKAMSQAYTSYIPEDKFPMCMLFLTINTLAVDVNVHPAKLEVKFSNEALVFGAVFRAVANTLARIREIPENEMISSPKVSEMPAPPEERIPSREKRQIDISSVVPEAMLPKYSAEPAKTESRAQSPYRSIESETVYVGGGSSSDDAERHVTPTVAAPEAERSGSVIEPVLQAKPADKTKTEAVPEPAQKTDSSVPEHEICKVEPESAATEEKPKAESAVSEAEEKQSSLGNYRYYKIIGELYNKYALVEAVTLDGQNKFLMIDKHAAHERMLFEELKRSYRFDMGAQMLMFPIQLSVSTYDAVTARLYVKTLEKYGFGITADLTTVNIHSIPNGLDETTATDIFHEIIDQLKEERIVTDEYLPEKIERALFTVACKAAIKGGRAYPPEFLDVVVKAVLSDPSIRFCPHGRPVAFEMSLTEIDARFKR